MTFYEHFKTFLLYPQQIWAEPDYDIELMVLRLQAANRKIVEQHHFDVWESELERDDA